jgi:hypothetical protein
MFLHNKFILANELVQKMNIHIANISNLLKQYECSGYYSVMIKMNNCTFINTHSSILPNNIKVGIAKNEFTILTNKLPKSFVHWEYPVTEKELFKSGIVVDKIKIAYKEFYVFDTEFVKKLNKKIGYILNKNETMCCYEKGQIEGFIELGKNKFFTWY